MAPNNIITTTAMAPGAKKAPRMEWLDAMRGFTMILVVAYHVSLIGFDQSIKESSVLPLFVLFRMPLFFFISGFLAYKSNLTWSGNTLGTLVWKKVKIQIFPTLVFLYVFVVVKYPDFMTGINAVMASPTKGGYWFTWSLLHMFIVYYLFSFVEYKLKWRSWIPIAILWFVALCIYATVYMPAWFTYHNAPFYKYSSLIQTMQFFHFFLFGNIVRRYWGNFQKLFDTRGFFLTCLIVAFICCADFLKWHVCRMQVTNLPRTTAMYTLLLIIFMTFRYYKDYFTKENRIGRMLQYIGARTLDIYLLHFLFMPNLKCVGKFLDANPHNFVLDTTISLVFSLLVVGFCIVVSNIIRISPFLKKYLFGR